MKHLKQEFDKLTFKEAIVYSMAFLSLMVGFVLIFIGLYTEPRGQIHESVITVFGIILVFVGSLMGISMHYAAELSRFKGTVSEQLACAIRDHLSPSSPSSPNPKSQSPNT